MEAGGARSPGNPQSPPSKITQRHCTWISVELSRRGQLPEDGGEGSREKNKAENTGEGRTRKQKEARGRVHRSVRKRGVRPQASGGTACFLPPGRQDSAASLRSTVSTTLGAAGPSTHGALQRCSCEPLRALKSLPGTQPKHVRRRKPHGGLNHSGSVCVTLRSVFFNLPGPPLFACHQLLRVIRLSQRVSWLSRPRVHLQFAG